MAKKKSNKKPAAATQAPPPPSSSPLDDFIGEVDPATSADVADEPQPPSPARGTHAPPPSRVSGAEDKPVVDGVLTRCPRCKSTDRGEYSNKREMAYAGTVAGEPFNVVVWRDTVCASCGQRRCDRHHELRP